MQPTLPPDVARCRPGCNTLLRKLHAADVSAVLLHLTGPGWIVEMPDYVDVDLSGYQAVSR